MAIKGKGQDEGPPARPCASSRAGRGEAAVLHASPGPGRARVRGGHPGDDARRLDHERSASAASRRPGRDRGVAAARGRAAVEERRSKASSARSARSHPALRPRCSPTSATTIAALQKGKVPDGATSTLTEAQSGAKSAAAQLEEVRALRRQVRDIGMDEGQVSWFLNSQSAIRAGAGAVRTGGRHRGARGGRSGRPARGRSPTRRRPSRSRPTRDRCRPDGPTTRTRSRPCRSSTRRSRASRVRRARRSSSVAAPGSVVVVANPTAGDGKAGRLIGRVNAHPG